MAIILILVLVALLFDFLNGMNDAANAIATVVSTRVLTPRLAVLWAAFFNFAAAFIFGLAVATTIGKGIIDPSIVNQQLIFAALFRSNHLDISVHPLWFANQCIPFFNRWLGGSRTGKSRNRVSDLDRIVKSIDIYMFYHLLVGLIISFILMIAVMWIFRSWTNRKVDRVFRIGQLFSSACYSLGHGTNDAQKTMGIIAILLFSSNIDLPKWFYDKSLGFYIPWWVVMAAYSAIGLGTLTGGWRVIHTLG